MTTMGYLVLIVFEPRSLIVSVIVNVLALMFAGVNPNVQTMGASTFGAVGMDLSYARWTVEMQFLQELRNYPSAAYKLGIIQNWLSYMGYYEAGKKSTANEFYETTPFDKTWYKVEFAVCVGHLILIGIVLCIRILRQTRNNDRACLCCCSICKYIFVLCALVISLPHVKIIIVDPEPGKTSNEIAFIAARETRRVPEKVLTLTAVCIIMIAVVTM